MTKGLGHDDNIGAALSALAAPTDELREYLEQFEHVLVDEAQDLVGERARFVFALISRLRPEAGWTCQKCGQTGNTGRFCSNCGAAKPE